MEVTDKTEITPLPRQVMQIFDEHWGHDAYEATSLNDTPAEIFYRAGVRAVFDWMVAWANAHGGTPYVLRRFTTESAAHATGSATAPGHGRASFSAGTD